VSRVEKLSDRGYVASVGRHVQCGGAFGVLPVDVSLVFPVEKEKESSANGGGINMRRGI
jgi:hypothetical protein